MAVTNILDQLGNFLTTVTTLQPEYAVLLISFLIALYPPIKRGVVDQRIDRLLESIDYSTGILTIGFLLSYYYVFGANLGQELILIAGGFVIGTFVTRTFSKLTGFK